MSQAQMEIMLIAAVIAVACSLVGIFLNLRKMAMMSDAISHTVLLGIVLAFFLTHDLLSPLLLVGAAVMGIITVYLVESLQQTRLLSQEASIGIVFPLLFSMAIVLISRYAGSVHLDTDTVLLGELVFASLDRIVVGGWSIPAALYSGAIILALNIIFITLFFKELKLTSFDPVFAATSGFSPAIMNYALMTMVAVTAVGAFNAVGSILVIAFMVGPGLTAYLLTDRLKKQIMLSVLLAIINAVLGYQLARLLDVSIAGSMALTTGLTFMTVFLFGSKNGYYTKARRNKSQKKEFEEVLILFHIYNHQKGEQKKLVTPEGLITVIKWKPAKITGVLQQLRKGNLVTEKNGSLLVTADGEKKAENYMNHIFAD